MKIFSSLLLFHCRCCSELKMLPPSARTPPLIARPDGLSSHIPVTSPSHLKPHVTLVEGCELNLIRKFMYS